LPRRQHKREHSPEPLRGEHSRVSPLTVHALEQTPREVLYVFFWEWLERVLLEKVEYAHPIQLGDETRVIAKVKVFVEVDAFAAGWSVIALAEVTTAEHERETGRQVSPGPLT
jgi:hypothetical protein